MAHSPNHPLHPAVAGHQHCRMRQKAIAFSNLFCEAIGLPRIPTDAATPHHHKGLTTAGGGSGSWSVLPFPGTPGPTLVKIDLETHNIISTVGGDDVKVIVRPPISPSPTTYIFSSAPITLLSPISFSYRRPKEEQHVNHEVEFMRILPGAVPAEVNFVQLPTYTDEKAALRGCESFLGCLVGGTEWNGIAYVSLGARRRQETEVDAEVDTPTLFSNTSPPPLAIHFLPKTLANSDRPNAIQLPTHSHAQTTLTPPLAEILPLETAAYPLPPPHPHSLWTIAHLLASCVCEA
ncbi:hypothetical protein BDN72DRAFT_905655 [Pluteus cervinus]|uniref:Uncharacterized protein n=1 Tax=Pluteus cervinus TaxID=181527 RepID=A0ACD3A1Q9_9AGAR|nr:hypothetical protein BDN72DRAFT_905655 [Pluteus cervinus]